MSKPKVFISYSQADKEWITKFVRSLEQQELSVWIDKADIEHGAVVSQEIDRALRGSDIIVSVLREEAINSPNIFFELGAAMAMGKRMMAVVPPDFDLRRLPGPLRERSFVVKSTPEKTAEAVISIATARGTDELSHAEISRIAQHITNYLRANGFTSVSFDRIRERINPTYTDELLLRVIDRLPKRFRRVRLKGGKRGIGLVKE